MLVLLVVAATCSGVQGVAASTTPPVSCAASAPHVNIMGKAYGTKYQVLRDGAGPAVEASKTSVSALVVGSLESGQLFWNSSSPPVGKPPHPGWFTFEFAMPPAGLIVGFDVGVHGMKQGETRELCIPPDEGYGQTAKPGIPSNSTLVFTITAQKVVPPVVTNSPPPPPPHLTFEDVARTPDDIVGLPEIMSYDDFCTIFGKARSVSRAQVFENNLRFIRAHNSEADTGLHSFRLGVNQFSDLTQAEWGAEALASTPLPLQPESERNVVRLSPVDSAATIDWRTKGAVTPVKNQGHCGACWAFSTTGSTEGVFQIATGALRSLSEQQLVDCAGGKWGNKGCQGGIMEKGYQYIVANGGIDGEKEYTYNATNGACWTAAEKRHVATVDSFADVAHKDEEQLQAAVMKNPVSIAIEADKPYFQHYKSGTLDNVTACGTKLDHGVLIVGMTADAYIVKNSWGQSWGMKGYLQLAKGVGGSNSTGMCGLAAQPTYPIKAKGSAPPIPPPTAGKRPLPKPNACGCASKQISMCGQFGMKCCWGKNGTHCENKDSCCPPK